MFYFPTRKDNQSILTTSKADDDTRKKHTRHYKINAFIAAMHRSKVTNVKLLDY